MKTNERLGDIWITSDTHYGHANIIRFCERPFADVQQMDEALIANYNAVVKPEDTVYHLGDFSFSREPERVFRRLNGKIHLILGNHDLDRHGEIRRWVDDLKWASVKDVYFLKLGKKPANWIWLSHYPHLTWNKSHKGSTHCHGHCHGDLPDDGKSRRFDVGVDAWNYKPVHVDEILKRAQKRELTFHH